ncbi:MAG: DUF1800 domain-containing protein [Pseudomonadota bacterium]
MSAMRHILRRSLRQTLVLCAVALLAACGGGGGDAPPPTTAPPAPITQAELEAASRLAAQATFGMPFEALEPMARQGTESWLVSQFNQPPTYHRPVILDIVQRREAGEFDAFEQDIEYLIFSRRLSWWHNTVTADDQLRQRVAFALSQIFVVSDNVDTLQVYPFALGTYYDLMLENAFGNFRDLLRDVALSPAMGLYLSHLNNNRSDPTNNIFPDENFAREVMQLFSIGLFELEPDGTVITDINGDPVPAYDNDDIREFAKVFTGLSFGGDNGFFGNEIAPRFDIPMQMFDANHEPGEKQLLNGAVIPAGLTGEQDIELAIDNLFNHPNVGPFIGQQLIQRLVTSNPSPAYVERVGSAFADNGFGVRGDMRAVIRAVLLDPEARDPNLAPNGGKLREPVVRYVSILRQFGATSDDGFIAALGYFIQELTRQHPLSAPSVFNFYLPDHSPAGEISDQGLVAPEFEITDANSIVNFPNFVDAILFGDFVTDAPPGFDAVTLTLEPWEALANDSVALVGRLETLVTYGSMDADTRAIIEAAVAEVQDPGIRTRAALYWMLTVPATAVRD